MKTTLVHLGIVTALSAAMGLAQAQTSPSPSDAGRTGTVSPSGTISSPGSIVTPGSPTIPAPNVPKAVTPRQGASSPTTPDAGSLSGTVDQRNRPTGDTLGSSTGNGGVYSPGSTGSSSGSGMGSGSSGSR